MGRWGFDMKQEPKRCATCSEDCSPLTLARLQQHLGDSVTTLEKACQPTDRYADSGEVSDAAHRVLGELQWLLDRVQRRCTQCESRRRTLVAFERMHQLSIAAGGPGRTCLSCKNLAVPTSWHCADHGGEHGLWGPTARSEGHS